VAKEAHPEEVLAELRSATGARGLAPGYVVRGEELYYRNAALDLLRALARSKNLELCQHDAKEPGFDAQRLLGDLAGGGLFSAGRMIVVHAPEELLKKDGAKERPLARAIPKFLAAGGGCVVLVAEGLRADNATVKALVAAGGSLLSFRKLYEKPAPWERHPDPRRTELSEWVGARAKARGVKISADQVVLLIASVGGELAVLENKLAEFALLPGGEFFQRLDASAPVSPFDLANALLRGDLRASLRDAEGLFHAGYKSKDGKLEVKPDALREILFSGLRSQVRRGVAASEGLRAGLSAEEAANQAGVSAYQMRDFQLALGARAPAAWRAMSADLARLERKARSGHLVDVNDFASFAVRWRKPRTAAQP